MLTKMECIYEENGFPQDDEQGDKFRLLTGRNLAHAKRSIVERAFVGADLHLNNLGLILPTVKQSACLVGVCVPYVAAAVAIADNQAAQSAVLAGKLTLLDAAKAATPESLAEHFVRATPAEWLEAARMIGPARVWDQMVMPLI
jgi:hypothetical protein